MSAVLTQEEIPEEGGKKLKINSLILSGHSLASRCLFFAHNCKANHLIGHCNLLVMWTLLKLLQTIAKGFSVKFKVIFLLISQKNKIKEKT